MKKIVHFLPTLADGGAETLVKDYALLLKNDYSILIILAEKSLDCANYNILKENGIKIKYLYPFKYSFILRLIKHFFDVRFFSKKLFKVIKKIKPDILHIHMALLKYVEPICKKIPNVKLFYTCHSLPSAYFFGTNSNELDAIKRIAKNHQISVIGLHDKMTDELKKILNIETCYTVQNLVNYSRFIRGKSERGIARKLINAADDTFVIGTVGRLSDVKNPFFTLDIFLEYLKMNSNSKLVFVGNGYMQNNLKEKINSLGLNNKVLILSHRTDVEVILQAFDAFVFPSKYEGLGISVIEAQLAQVPVFVSSEVPEDTKISGNYCALDLKLGPLEWARKIESFMPAKWEFDYKFDSPLVLKKLLHLYFGE